MTLGLDIDGCVRDWVREADGAYDGAVNVTEYDLVKRYNGDAEYVERLFHGDLAKQVYEDALAVDGALAFIHTLHVRGVPWCFVTAQPSEEHEDVTRDWIEWHVAAELGIPMPKIVFCKTWEDKLAAPVDLLLDDDPRVIEAGDKVIAFDAPYNQNLAAPYITWHGELWRYL